jgi:hypothetical protein
VEAEEIEAAIRVVALTEIYYRYMQEKTDLARTRMQELIHALYLWKLA